MTIDEILAEARARLDRVGPAGARALQETGALIVDIRPSADRAAEGEIPGSVPVERIRLEWRLDPAGTHRLPGVHADRPVVVVCNEGYASSLAAADLLRLGLRATDLDGGFRAWVAAGLPTRPGPTPAVP
ncbi:rhodanese-like domain-containing protein [Amycolatopsis alkalitolerans]|uniref:Rhodanese-like domain-containing protein n=1 Tax=Amycolatopsis alkalitolerans TaxID=2547244 RepID=A0A5C4M060_9PSEU|nr:rhodanese-like domain-containing protein [Amycolatopsis alkalitolerans]TNC24590.1 rhodanese-like domain-containing protein [Amycolatopsis alkalitolerans]